MSIKTIDIPNGDVFHITRGTRLQIEYDPTQTGNTQVFDVIVPQDIMVKMYSDSAPFFIISPDN